MKFHRNTRQSYICIALWTRSAWKFSPYEDITIRSFSSTVNSRYSNSDSRNTRSTRVYSTFLNSTILLIAKMKKENGAYVWKSLRKRWPWVTAECKALIRHNATEGDITRSGITSGLEGLANWRAVRGSVQAGRYKILKLLHGLLYCKQHLYRHQLHSYILCALILFAPGRFRRR